MILGPAQVLPFGPTTTGGDVLTVPGILHGWALQNTSLTARADVRLTDGPVGPLIVPVALGEGCSTRDWLSGTGIQLITGCTVVVTDGEVEGVLWFRPLEAGGTFVPLDVHQTIDNLIDAMWSR